MIKKAIESFLPLIYYYYYIYIKKKMTRSKLPKSLKKNPSCSAPDSKSKKIEETLQTKKPSHKRKLASQIQYEKLGKIQVISDSCSSSPSIQKTPGAELTAILKESLETFNKFLTMQNSLSFFNYFPFYPQHVKSSLLKQALKSTEDLQSFLENGKFDAPHPNTSIYEKKINYGNAQLLRHNQEGMIDDLFKIRKDLKASRQENQKSPNSNRGPEKAAPIAAVKMNEKGKSIYFLKKKKCKQILLDGSKKLK